MTPLQPQAEAAASRMENVKSALLRCSGIRARQLPLPHEVPVIEQMLENDCLAVIAKGLGAEHLATQFLSSYFLSRRERRVFDLPVILCIGLPDEREFRRFFRSPRILSTLGLESVPFLWLGAEARVSQRIDTICQGGVFGASAKTFVLDILSARLAPELIDVVLVLNAHAFLRNTNQVFLIQILKAHSARRLSSPPKAATVTTSPDLAEATASLMPKAASLTPKAAVIKAITDCPDYLVRSFSQAERSMRLLGIKNLVLVPRSHKLVQRLLADPQIALASEHRLLKSTTTVLEIQKCLLALASQGLDSLRRSRPKVFASALPLHFNPTPLGGANAVENYGDDRDNGVTQSGMKGSPPMFPSPAATNLSLDQLLELGDLDRAFESYLPFLTPQDRRTLRDVTFFRSLTLQTALVDAASFYLRILTLRTNSNLQAGIDQSWFLTPELNRIFHLSKNRVFTPVVHTPTPTPTPTHSHTPTQTEQALELRVEPAPATLDCLRIIEAFVAASRTNGLFDSLCNNSGVDTSSAGVGFAGVGSADVSDKWEQMSSLERDVGGGKKAKMKILVAVATQSEFLSLRAALMRGVEASLLLPCQRLLQILLRDTNDSSQPAMRAAVEDWLSRQPLALELAAADLNADTEGDEISVILTETFLDRTGRKYPYKFEIQLVQVPSDKDGVGGISRDALEAAFIAFQPQLAVCLRLDVSWIRQLELAHARLLLAFADLRTRLVKGEPDFAASADSASFPSSEASGSLLSSSSGSTEGGTRTRRVKTQVKDELASSREDRGSGDSHTSTSGWRDVAGRNPVFRTKIFARESALDPSASEDGEKGPPGPFSPMPPVIGEQELESRQPVVRGSVAAEPRRKRRKVENGSGERGADDGLSSTGRDGEGNGGEEEAGSLEDAFTRLEDASVAGATYASTSRVSGSDGVGAPMNSGIGEHGIGQLVSECPAPENVVPGDASAPNLDVAVGGAAADLPSNSTELDHELAAVATDFQNLHRLFEEVVKRKEDGDEGDEEEDLWRSVGAGLRSVVYFVGIKGSEQETIFRQSLKEEGMAWNNLVQQRKSLLFYKQEGSLDRLAALGNVEDQFRCLLEAGKDLRIGSSRRAGGGVAAALRELRQRAAAFEDTESFGTELRAVAAHTSTHTPIHTPTHTLTHTAPTTEELRPSAVGKKAIAADIDTLLRKDPARLLEMVKPSVVVDVREFKSSLPLQLWSSGLRVLPLTLPVADYVLTPDFGLERKSLPDLLQSLASGRLFRQCERLERAFSSPAILIEFDHTAQGYLRSLTGDALSESISPSEVESDRGDGDERGASKGGPSGRSAFQLSRKRGTNLDMTPELTLAKLCVLMIHFPRIKFVWSPDCFFSTQIITRLKANKPQPDRQILTRLTNQVDPQALSETDAESEAQYETEAGQGARPKLSGKARLPHLADNIDAVDLLQRVPGISHAGLGRIVRRCESLRDLVNLSRGGLEKVLGITEGAAVTAFLDQDLRL